MPLIRKVAKIGNSKAVFLPKTWLEYHEEESGQQIKKVIIEVNDELRIKPVFNRRQTKDDDQAL
jgi:antitoxin component of MazEF toxin-antitoxin module